MAGQFTPAEAQQRYDEEVSSNKVFANCPATLIRKDPQLLRLAIAFLQGVASKVLSEGNGVVFTDVGGWLEDEDPSLFERLVKAATSEQIRFMPTSRVAGEHEFIVDSEIKQKGILLILTDWRREGEAYAVRGYFCQKNEDMQIVKHRIRNVGGTWVVED